MTIKKICAILFMALLMTTACAFAEEAIDVKRDVSLTVIIKDEGKALSGVQFRLYRIADIDEKGIFSLAKPFDAYNIKINSLKESDMAGVASTLEGYVLRDKITPYSMGISDKEGKVEFSKIRDMKAGLYLVVGDLYVENGAGYIIQPSVVKIPAWNQEENQWDYTVVINAKHEIKPDLSLVSRKVLKVWKNTEGLKDVPKEVTIHLLRDGVTFDSVNLNDDNLWRHAWENLDGSYQWTVVEEVIKDYSVTITKEGITFVVTNTYDPEDPKPTPKPTPTPPPDEDDPKLPQTGQLWWPVPMLICAGLFFILLGLIRRKGR